MVANLTEIISYGLNVAIPAIPGINLLPLSTVTSESSEVIDATVAAMDTLKEIIVSLGTMWGDYYDLVNILNWLPDQWLSIIMLSVGIVITLRIYSFGKDLFP